MYKRALITGASSGLGKELACRLAKRGLSLILVAKDAAALTCLCNELPHALPVVCDLSSPDDREKLLALIKTHLPDLVINNAGIGFYGPIVNHPLAVYQQIVEVNLNAILDISITAATALHTQGRPGTVMNISSAVAFFPYPTFAVYAASKTFINQFSQAFDDEMKAYNIRILTACPGPFNTSFRCKASQGISQDHDRMTMDVEEVASEVLKQLDTKQTLRIINWRYRIAIFLSKLLPQRALFFLLKWGIKDRYTHTT